MLIADNRLWCTLLITDTSLCVFMQSCCWCCCLSTPMTLATRGSPIFPLVIHQSDSPFIWPVVPSLQRGLSTNPGVDNVVRMRVQLKRQCVLCMWVLQRGHVMMYVSWRRLCVSMIWERVIYWFWAGQRCDDRGWEVSLQIPLMRGSGVHSIYYCLLWLDAQRQ